jgi:SAM-dependent methyltransferase
MFSIISKNPNKRWTHILCILAIIFVCVFVYNKYYAQSRVGEGFSQDSPYEVMRDSEVYDEFYVEIYDNIMKPEIRSDFEIETIVNSTFPSKKHSVFLDIGSGTGHLANKLHSQGYQVQTIDKSKAMVKYANEKYPKLNSIQGDTMDPMTFDRGVFTHILCLGMTIYEIPDKLEFFRNCFYWLQMNGYMIIHLVDRQKFDAIVPAGKNYLLESPQRFASDRITDTIIDFESFKYNASYNFNGKTVGFSEKIIDGKTNNVRQNERTLYMDEPNDIIYFAQYAGFIVHGAVKMTKVGDENQFIYILERPM